MTDFIATDDLPLETAATILVVDDVDFVLKVVVDILKNAHYNVLHAHSGSEALELASQHDGKIDLLLSDVQMPGMTGPKLGEELIKVRPATHVMFMSAYPSGNLLVLNYGWSFLEKPFVADGLLQMVKDVLAAPNKSQGTHKFDTRENTGTTGK